jgi:hypothetical protein
LLYVGRIAAEKNLNALLAAYAAARAQARRSRLVLAGDGPARIEMQARCPEAILVGTRRGEDLAVHYASADVFLFPSLTETYGNVTLEALASGLADWGAPGILIYAVMAVYAVALWRMCQWSPRLFTALLMTANGMYFFDLFWENNGVFAIRTIGFSWLVLLVLGPLLAPTVRSAREAI